MVTVWPIAQLQHPILLAPSKGIIILGVLLGTSSFTLSFIEDALLEDVQHVNLLLRMGDVQVGTNFLRCTKILSQHHLFYPFYLIIFYHVKTHLWFILMESTIVIA
jgi:hypothetical protein